MGSVLTHYGITGYVADQLAAARPGENYTYVYLGNFLTDLSQVRDPYACIHAKAAVLQGMRFAGVLGVVASTRAGAWLADLLGQARPASRRYGALTQFLALMARAGTHAVFAADSPLRTGRWPLLAAALSHLADPLAPEEVDRVLSDALTQYYPHEHLDFPPYYDPAGENVRNAPRGAAGPAAPGRLIAYLAEQRQYLVEELTRTEVAWLTVSGRGTAAQRGDVLRRLGHLLHAVEDYYFHSNFAELHQWQRVQRAAPPSPFTLPGIPDAGAPPVSPMLLLHGLDGSADSATDVALRRRFARRLRYPAFSRDGAGVASTATYWDGPSTTTSGDASRLVLTGGFGGNDLFHSLAGGLEIAAMFLDPESDLVLVKLVANVGERRKAAADDAYQDTLVETHAKQLATGSYRKRIADKYAHGDLSPAMADALAGAFAIDAGLQREHGFLAGVGGFLIRMLCRLQQELDASELRVETLNGDMMSILGEATDNGSSAETIGTHSLLAKDTGKEKPMRKTAVALAAYASASVATLMARRVTSDRDASRSLDWDSITAHFLRYPVLAPGSWESAVIAAVNADRNPDPAAITDRPDFAPLGRGATAAKLARLRAGGKRAELEEYYRKLEALEDL
jgi:hypothetical protein